MCDAALHSMTSKLICISNCRRLPIKFGEEKKRRMAEFQWMNFYLVRIWTWQIENGKRLKPISLLRIMIHSSSCIAISMDLLNHQQIAWVCARIQPLTRYSSSTLCCQIDFQSQEKREKKLKKSNINWHLYSSRRWHIIALNGACAQTCFHFAKKRLYIYSRKANRFSEFQI